MAITINSPESMGAYRELHATQQEKEPSKRHSYTRNGGRSSSSGGRDTGRTAWTYKLHHDPHQCYSSVPEA